MNNSKQYVEFFENLNRKSQRGDYTKFFDENSYFEDPFQKVKGIDKIYFIFEDMYAKLYNPRFVIQECISNKDISYIKWKFIYSNDKQSKENSFIGISRVEFSKNGKVLKHVDFWDAGANVYEKIPVLGSIIRFIKSKIHA
jgi:hypothetical protein